MGTFDSYADTPNQIKLEGDEISLKFQRSGPTTGRVSWNIPPPVIGCAAEDQAYCGMLVTLDTVPNSPETIPVDGTYYTGDPTADRDLHVGDKIGTALVIGAFYEGVKKGTGEQLTTFFDITGLEGNTPYFITGHAVDCEGRYHSDGARAYSDPLGKADTTAPNNQGFQLIGFNPTGVTFDADLLDTTGSEQFFAGVAPTDATGLEYGTEYEFTFLKDVFEEDPKNPGTRITILGENAMTYLELVEELNRQFGLLEECPQSPQPPGTNTYYWDGSTLYSFDGTSLTEVPVIVEPTDPAARAVGDYWYNPSTGDLFQWNGAIWDPQTYISFERDPTQPHCHDYWFDGTDIFRWDGVVWCETDFCIQTNDPSALVYPVCGDYWYNETEMILNRWNDKTFMWDQVFAILWPTDPNAPVTGTYWVKEDTEELFIRNTPAPNSWNPVLTMYTFSETEPVGPSANDFWIQLSTETLFQRNAGNTDWVEIPAFVMADDPTDRDSCDLWWQSTSDELRIWNTQNNTWVLVNTFTISTVDPASAPSLTVGKVWYNPTDMTLQYWDGNCWIQSGFISSTFDPTSPPVGTEWFDTTNDLWFTWNGASWDPIDPIDSDTDPNAITTGDFWYDTTNDALFQWNGTAWVSIMFVTTDPTPAVGTEWYDSINDLCMVWNGSAWVEKEPACVARVDECGNIILASTTQGSGSSFAINLSQPYTLWQALDPQPTINPPIFGTEGVSGTPSYNRIGCGTDGTPDERRELAHSLRAQLGYPVVEVELTKYQMDEAIQSALEDFRLRSSGAYKRAFFFLDMEPGVHRYILANERVGFLCIVTIMDIRRLTSAFLTTAFGSGAYGQVVLQHLYNMGTFDLLSYDLVSQYIEQLEHLFASRMTWHWDESTRALDIYQTISTPERVLVDAMIERTEQELLSDRWIKTWLERRALAECRYMLAEIRGKYGSLPGAGGGVQLNAAELISRADQEIQICMDDLDNFVSNEPEDVGLGSTFVIG